MVIDNFLLVTKLSKFYQYNRKTMISMKCLRFIIMLRLGHHRPALFK